MTTETLIIAGLIFLPIVGSVIGYSIGYHDAKKNLSKTLLEDDRGRSRKMQKMGEG